MLTIEQAERLFSWFVRLKQGVPQEHIERAIKALRGVGYRVPDDVHPATLRLTLTAHIAKFPARTPGKPKPPTNRRP